MGAQSQVARSVLVCTVSLYSRMQRVSLCMAIFVAASSEQCPAPPGASAFDMQALSGTWYEVGKVQTFGGAIFEGSCVCTQLEYSPHGTDGSATVSNICRQKTPQGKLVVANATISPKAGKPGSFTEKFAPIML